MSETLIFRDYDGVQRRDIDEVAYIFFMLTNGQMCFSLDVTHAWKYLPEGDKDKYRAEARESHKKLLEEDPWRKVKEVEDEK